MYDYCMINVSQYSKINMRKSRNFFCRTCKNSTICLQSGGLDRAQYLNQHLDSKIYDHA